MTSRLAVTALSVVVAWVALATALDAWGTSSVDLVLQAWIVLALVIAGAALAWRPGTA
ncbi:MAG: hypothetical protein ABEJ31_05430 [Haloarculaceae archaeon]